MAAASSAVALQSSPLFSKLPAELRNNIYELSFTSDNDDEEVNLLEAKPPSKALLLTCQRANAEAKGLYQEAYRKYWSSTKFTIACMKIEVTRRFRESKKEQTAAIATLRAIPDQDLEHIQHISVKTTWWDGDAKITQRVDPRGGWQYSRRLPSNVPLFYGVFVNEGNGEEFRVTHLKRVMRELLSQFGTTVPLTQQLLIIAFDTEDRLRRAFAKHRKTVRLNIDMAW